jgi:DNA repair exonuclease SbcCD ATPase subunit
MDIATHGNLFVEQSSHRICFLKILGGFLDGQTLNFSNGLNCLIGARGTGKTTALEFMRYALDLLPYRDEAPAERRRIDSLVERNLNGGRIQVGIETKDGLSYVVSRSWGEEPIVLDTNGAPTEITLHCGGLFKADIYSQNEVETIADRSIFQLELIDNFAAQQITALETNLRQVCSALKANAGQIGPLKSQLGTLAEELGTLPGLEARLKAFSDENSGNTEEINRAHALRALRDREQRSVTAAKNQLDQLNHDLEDCVGRLKSPSTTLFEPAMNEEPNGSLFNDIIQQLGSCGHDVDQLLEGAKNRVTRAQNDLAANSIKLSALHKEQDLAFRAIIEKHQEAQGKAAERMQLERSRNDLMAKKRTQDELRQRLSVLLQNRTELIAKLSELRDERFAIRQTVADRINKSLMPAIKVSIMQFGNPECYLKLLEDRLRGTRMKFGVVAQKLANSFWPDELSAAIQRKDLQTLVERAELNQDQSEKVVSALSDPETLFDLEIVELMDQPRIELKDGETYKDSAALSTGQKCTAILPILLLESKNPLMVDQPEDNLDNRFIFETVVSSIRHIKQKRQLVFVTHNPNIPVLADAERIFVLDSDGSTARKANEGTVDQCKTNIVTLLEGGEEAFRQRKERYSY